MVKLFFDSFLANAKRNAVLMVLQTLCHFFTKFYAAVATFGGRSTIKNLWCQSDLSPNNN